MSPRCAARRIVRGALRALTHECGGSKAAHTLSARLRHTYMVRQPRTTEFAVNFRLHPGAGEHVGTDAGRKPGAGNIFGGAHPMEKGRR